MNHQPTIVGQPGTKRTRPASALDESRCNQFADYEAHEDLKICELEWVDCVYAMNCGDADANERASARKDQFDSCLENL